MIAYIGQHKHRYGVEPICRVLPIAPSTYQHTKGPPSSIAVRDAQLKVEIAGVHRALRRLRLPQGLAPAAPRGIAVARCTVERLMGELHLAGVRRGRPPDHHARCDRAAPRRPGGP